MDGDIRGSLFVRAHSHRAPSAPARSRRGAASVADRTVRAAVLILALLAAGCASRSEQASSKSAFLLDTSCTITLYDPAPAGTLDEAFAIVRDIDERMSMYDPKSEVSRVNQGAGSRPVAVSADTLELARRADAFSALGDGAFDVTVGPLVKLWGIGTDHPAVPSASSLDAALRLVGYRDLRIDPVAGTLFLPRSGMSIDFGGIAKGYAAERVKEFLQSRGVRRAIIDFGGNIVALGSRPGGEPWRIGIQDPNRARGTFIAVVGVRDRAVVTSGKYERFFMVGDRRYHHILDPRTGYPVENGIASVTIVARDSTTADALTKVVFVPGIERGFALLAAAPEPADAIVVMEDARIYATAGIAGALRVTDPSYTLAAALP